MRSFAEFERRFGPLSADTYVPQTVREYLKNAGSVTVCRVLAGGGYTYANGANEVLALVASGSAGNVFLGAIYPSKALSVPDLSTSTLVHSTVDGDQSKGLNKNFSLTLNGTNVTSTQFSASINPANTNYIFKQLGNSPNNSKNGTNTYSGTPGYGYLNFKTLQTSIAAASTVEAASITFATGTILTASLANAGLGAYASGTGSFFLTPPDANFADGEVVETKRFVLQLFLF